VVAVVVICSGLNPDWFILRIQLSDKKERSCTLTKYSITYGDSCQDHLYPHSKYVDFHAFGILPDKNVKLEM
jgi:hypothetical protein